MNFADAVAWIYGTQMHGIKLGLEPIRKLTEALGVPVSGNKAPRFLHVAGTNGKGSVCAMLDSICRAQGFQTGLFISPHLVTFRERIRVNGEMISPPELASGVDEIRTVVADWEYPPTFFEIATALALAFFHRKGAAIAVLETGMGGRLDATNIVRPAVSVITPIAFDHQQFLGNSLAAIATEKAGIIKTGVPVVSARQPEEVHNTLVQAAIERNAPLEFVSSPVSHLPLGLAGSHQGWNAALALRALEMADIAVSADAIAQGLRTVDWPGRFQRIDDRFILDGAHNPAAATRLAETWREIYGPEKATIVLGVLKDKDVRGICQALLPIAGRVIAVPVKNDRTASAGELAATLRELGAECTMAADISSALQATDSPRVLITGSLFLVGEALVLLGQSTAEIEKSSQ